MMVDTTVYGYIFDGYVLHPDCVESDEDRAAVDDGTAGRLYSMDDNEPEGMTCDGCGDYIFEPDYGLVLESELSDILYRKHVNGASDYQTVRAIMSLFGDDDELIRLFLANR